MLYSLVFSRCSLSVTEKAHSAYVRVVARVVCGAEALGAHEHEACPLARPAAEVVRAGVSDEAADRREVEQLHAPPVLLEQCVALRECNRTIFVRRSIHVLVCTLYSVEVCNVLKRKYTWTSSLMNTASKTFTCLDIYSDIHWIVIVQDNYCLR